VIHYQTPAGKTETAKLTKADPPEPKYGDLVAVRCSATGRYLTDGLALVVSAMDNSLFLDDVDLSREPAPDAVVPPAWALSGAVAVMTSSKYERKAKRRPVQ